MAKIFVFQLEEGVSKANKPYFMHRIQIVQTPERQDARDAIFVRSKEEAYEPGPYTADAYYVETPQGCRPRWYNLVPADK